MNRESETSGTLIIGRSSSADLVIRSAKISRRHCSLIPSGNGFVIQDHESRNGIWVEGKRVKSAFLKRGDRFSVANVRIRIKRDGSLEVEGIKDPAQLTFMDRIKPDLPAVYAMVICAVIVIGFYQYQRPETPVDPMAADPTGVDPLPRWQPDETPSVPEAETDPVVARDESAPTEEVLDTYATNSGREWSLEELLELAEAIEATQVNHRQEQLVAAPDEIATAGSDSSELVMPESFDPWQEVQRIRNDRKARRRIARAGTRVNRNKDATASDPTMVVNTMSVEEWLAVGREALASYHIPAEVMPGFTAALDGLLSMRGDEAWAAVNTLRIESSQMLRSVAARARKIGEDYGHLDRNSDAPLSAGERREAELALNLLVLIQEQMQILLAARDAAFEAMCDPLDSQMLVFAVAAALESDDDELLDLVLDLTIENKADEVVLALIKGLQVPSASRKLKLQDALQRNTGQKFRSKIEWERWWNESERSLR